MYEQRVVRYAPSTNSTTSGPTGSCSSGARRVRVVRLVRPRKNSSVNFGFSLRGGREHAAGFFISKVEPNSEAFFQGLKCGDQVITVNGFRVDDAVHSELAHYISTQQIIKMKVRNMGVIPIREKSNERLTWRFISENTSTASESSSSPTLCHENERLKEVQLPILVPPRAKLGCGICKGPDWKPGIFVQFVKDHGIAKESGLRAGDQILACNGIDFRDITFNEAVAIMKQCGHLTLTIRVGAGLELVCDTSSGYNSSASSAAGDLRQYERYNSQMKIKSWDSVDFEWKNSRVTHQHDSPSDVEPDYDGPSIPNNPHSYDNQIKKDLRTKATNKTIINLTENGATIECSYDSRNNNISENIDRRYNLKNDKKTVVVEVHHNSSQSSSDTNTGSNKDSDSMTTLSSNTFTNAILEEIERRKSKRDSVDGNYCLVKTRNTLKSPICGIDDEKKKQHDALMDEFKKMHKKMFSNNKNEDDSSKTNGESKQGDLDKERQATLQNKKNQAAGAVTNGTSSNKSAPPPPPPMPKDSSNVTSLQSANVTNMNGSSRPVHIPPPDYNADEKKISPKINGHKDEKLELESMDSYKLSNPNTLQPKPPPNYFFKPPNGPTKLKKINRPVSITFGEYPTKTSRKEPSKLDFLGDEVKSEEIDEADNIGSRLQSELALTLSRSNLKKKMDNVVKKDQFQDNNIILDSDNKYYESSLNGEFHLRYGNNLMPLPPKVLIPKISIKSVNLNGIVEDKTKLDPFKCDTFPHDGTVKEKTLFLNGVNKCS